MKNADDYSKNKTGGLKGNRAKHLQEVREAIEKVFKQSAGNVSAIARAVGVTRRTVRYHLSAMGLNKKPLTAGKMVEREERKMPLPPKGIIKRYICTAAQNNTPVNMDFLEALEVLADYYDAEILVGTFTYNQNSFGKLAVKRGTKKEHDSELWYDPEIEEYIQDERLELANGLVWCGEMNILPTAVDPLSGLETYTHRKSAIFPHAKLAMRSIATMQGEGTKLNYTTGACTQRNYIQKKEGLKAEHHHRYAALVVEVNSKGHWWVRQIGIGSKTSNLHDLDVGVVNGKIVKNQGVEAITWGDLHASKVDKQVVSTSMDMLDTLKPRYQFLHDVMEGISINRHVMKSQNPHDIYKRWLRGFHRVCVELKVTADVLNQYQRPWAKTIVPDSNHDGWWLKSWLANADYRKDASNAKLFLELQSWMYSQIEGGLDPKEVNLTEYALVKHGANNVKFLLADESFTICGNKIECGMHGHLGPNGARGTPNNLHKIGRRANTGHTHSAGIWNGLYVAGTSSELKWDYAYGPSSWSHSHIVTYPNGLRTIVTMYDGRWRAVEGE